jgi:alkylation response protein AidB-like acyl-CoA dehydrogenase
MTVDDDLLIRTLDAVLPVPLPGAGSTDQRFRKLAEIAAYDLAIARLIESHLDAIAICDEAGRFVPNGVLGVWASDPPPARLQAAATSGGWSLSGIKLDCAGAGTLDNALVTAHAGDGYRLFLVALDSAGIQIRTETWRAVGMRDSDSYDVEFDGVLVTADDAVGGPDWYLRRRGFWIGGVGVAACWYGGALGALRALRAAVKQRRKDPHGLAHLGAADALCAAMWAHLESAAAAIDAGIAGSDLARLAWRVRASVERLAADVLDHAERGIGAGGLARDAEMARRAADLPVYLRQHHAERDLEALGEQALEEV